MTKGYEEEFATVELLLHSKTRTGRTDAFIISYAKLEKQPRRLFCYLIFHYPNINISHFNAIVAILESKRYLDFDNYIKGIDALYPKSYETIIGSQIYSTFMKSNFKRIKEYRNKILHGQLTGHKLSANELRTEVEIIRGWCKQSAVSMKREINYDGLEWNAFRKNIQRELASEYKIKRLTLPELDAFIDSNMK
jgi:hypothetical protein